MFITVFDLTISGSIVHGVSIGYRLNLLQREVIAPLTCHVGITVLTDEGWWTLY
jgi:hypothetical protein